MTESKRVKALRLAIAKQIPKFPNDRASLKALEAKSLGALLIDYANWAIRYIAARPRTVEAELTASTDPRWLSLGREIQALLQKVEQGADLTPHLSLLPHTRGFTPASSGTGADVDRWADKDMLLNVMGYHHLHLDAAPHNQMRSNEVLFAHVTRAAFTVVGLFDHSVFESTEPGSSMTRERERLWTIFEERASRGAPPGAVMVLSPIATSGHSLYFTSLAMDYARVVREIDPKLDEIAYVRGLYEQAGLTIPARPQLKWHLHLVDLGLLDQRSGIFFALRKGPN